MKTRLRHLVVAGEGLELPIEFSLEEFYTPVGPAAERVKVVQGQTSLDLIEYLNEAYLDFYTADGSLFSGNELFVPKEDALPIGMNQVVPWDWVGVDIESEVTAGEGLQSVQERVRRELEQGTASIICFDHGTGEIADYVAITEEVDATVFSFYHCKGSGGPTAGARMEDVYEVCGQAQKSVAWASLVRLERRLRYRQRGDRFIRGNNGVLQEVMNRAKEKRQRFEIKVVQPGISKARVTAAMAECLGATSGHLIGIASLEVITSG